MTARRVRLEVLHWPTHFCGEAQEGDTEPNLSHGTGRSSEFQRDRRADRKPSSTFSSRLEQLTENLDLDVKETTGMDTIEQYEALNHGAYNPEIEIVTASCFDFIGFNSSSSRNINHNASIYLDTGNPWASEFRCSS